MAMTMMMVAIQGKREGRSRSCGPGQVSRIATLASLYLCVVLTAHRRQTQLTNLVSIPRQVDILWNKQDLAMILLYHAISISLLPFHKSQSYDKKRQQTKTILADLKSTFWLTVIVCKQYSFRNQFCFFPSLFSFPGMDAWTEQCGHTYDFAVQLPAGGIENKLTWENVLHDAHNVDIPHYQNVKRAKFSNTV